MILDIIYGIRIDDMENEYVALLEAGGKSFGPSKVPGAFWVDNFPLLRYVPAWVPGAAARKFGKHYKPQVLAMRHRPFEDTRQAMVCFLCCYTELRTHRIYRKRDGSSKPSCVAYKLIKRLEQYSGSEPYLERELHAKNAAGTAYIGTETRYSMRR